MTIISASPNGASPKRGNRCGHDPAHPGFDLDAFLEGRKRPPAVLVVLMQRLIQFYFDPQIIETLNKANGSWRQMRSERRQACIWVLWGLLLFCDLASLRVGRPTAEGFVSYPLRVIANWTGLPMRRLERALVDLQAAGLIRVSIQKRQRLPGGAYIGYASVRIVAKELFALFGLHNWLKHSRRFISGRLHEWAKQQKRTLTQVARFKLMERFLAYRTGPPSTAPPPGPPASSGDAFRKRWNRTLFQLSQAYPDWTIEQYYSEARRRLHLT
jgi:hypothetical protein